MTKVTFVTGNPHKAEHFNQLVGLDLAHKKLDLDEIQDKNPEVVIRHKVEQAYRLLGSPVIVDDFSLGFDELDSLPGPFIKFFVGADNGLESLCRMADGLSNRNATARGYIGYCDQSGVTIMHGELAGRIAQHPRGSAEYSFGADSIFELPDYDYKTRAELSQNQYDEVYRIVRPIDQVKNFLSQGLDRD